MSFSTSFTYGAGSWKTFSKKIRSNSASTQSAVQQTKINVYRKIAVEPKSLVLQCCKVSLISPNYFLFIHSPFLLFILKAILKEFRLYLLVFIFNLLCDACVVTSRWGCLVLGSVLWTSCFILKIILLSFQVTCPSSCVPGLTSSLIPDCFHLCSPSSCV